MGILERIKEIEAEMARTQKNKATGCCLAFTAPTVQSLPLTACCLFISSFGGIVVLQLVHLSRDERKMLIWTLDHQLLI
jgi:hypothetical protein